MDRQILHIDPANRSRPLFQIIGWQERVQLPSFGSQPLVAKIDTGASMSCLHAYDFRRRWHDDQMRVSFRTNHPAGWTNSSRRFSARVIDLIAVRSSNGKLERRYVIETQMKLGSNILQGIRLTLSDRSAMQFPLLLGRDAISGFYAVDSGRTFVLESPSRDDFYLT